MRAQTRTPSENGIGVCSTEPELAGEFINASFAHSSSSRTWAHCLTGRRN